MPSAGASIPLVGDGVLREGRLLKYCGRRFSPKWKPVWVRFDRYELAYFKTQSPAPTARASKKFALHEFALSIEQEQILEYMPSVPKKVDLKTVCMIVHKNSGYALFFSAESEAARDQWASDLARAMVQDAHSREPHVV